MQWISPTENFNQEFAMIPVKIQCGCGQRYAFDIEPMCGRMPGRVTCPVCGLDGTRVANEIIAFNLATELSVEKSSPNIVMIFAVIGCLMAGIAGVVKALSMADGVNVLLCLLGATGAFGMALCVYFWKR
jgi:hypothetical protein